MTDHFCEEEKITTSFLSFSWEDVEPSWFPLDEDGEEEVIDDDDVGCFILIDCSAL